MSLALEVLPEKTEKSPSDIVKKYLGDMLRAMGGSSSAKAAEKYTAAHPLKPERKDGLLRMINDMKARFSGQAEKADTSTRIKYDVLKAKDTVLKAFGRTAGNVAAVMGVDGVSAELPDTGKPGKPDLKEYARLQKAIIALQAMKGMIAPETVKKNSLHSKIAVSAVAGATVLSSVFAVSKGFSAMQDDFGNDTKIAYAVNMKGDTICSFKVQNTDDVSLLRLNKLVRTAAKTQTGRDVLRQASKNGTALSIGGIGKGIIGYFAPEENLICLNAVMSDDALESCLVHEGKHSVQTHDSQKVGNLPYGDCYELGTAIKLQRVMEADAVATQTKYAYEMAQQGNTGAWDFLVAEHKGITTTFEQNAQKYGKDDNRTMKETMLAWYDDYAYVYKYDDMKTQYVTAKTSVSKIMLQNSFNTSVSTDSLLKYVCTVDGVNYSGFNENLLETPRTKYLDGKVYEKAEKVSTDLTDRGLTKQNIGDFYKMKSENQVDTVTYNHGNQQLSILSMRAGNGR